jgi:hypothetical protein
LIELLNKPQRDKYLKILTFADGLNYALLERSSNERLSSLRVSFANPTEHTAEKRKPMKQVNKKWKSYMTSKTRMILLGSLFAVQITACTSVDGASGLNEKRREAVAAVQNYAYAQKAEFVSQMNIELGKAQVELDRLSAKVESSAGSAKIDAQAKLTAAQEKWTQAKNQLSQAEKASEPTWNEMKSGFANSYNELNSSLDDTRQWLSEKLAP